VPLRALIGIAVILPAVGVQMTDAVFAADTVFPSGNYFAGVASLIGATAGYAAAA
jgi:hypothetical protein